MGGDSSMRRLEEDLGKRIAEGGDDTVALAPGAASAKRSKARVSPFPNNQAQRSHINRGINKPLRTTYIQEILFNLGVLNLRCRFYAT